MSALPDPEKLVRALAERDARRDRAPTRAWSASTPAAPGSPSGCTARSGSPTPLGVLAVTLHRDDFGRIGLHRESRRSQIPFPVDGREVVLVDDVLHTGRTIRAALNELFDFGRPRAVRLAVLADRGGRELPVAPDFIGAQVEVARRRGAGALQRQRQAALRRGEAAAT